MLQTVTEGNTTSEMDDVEVSRVVRVFEDMYIKVLIVNMYTLPARVKKTTTAHTLKIKTYLNEYLVNTILNM